MTREQVEKEMAQYRTIFTVVRLLEAAQVGSDKTLSDYCKCYDFWQKHTQCQNCISAQVLRDHTQRTKLEYMGSQVFQVTAVYREVDGQPCVMELIQQLDSETLIAPENSDRLMDSVTGYHFKLYHDALTGGPAVILRMCSRARPTLPVWPCWTWTTSSSTTIPTATTRAIWPCAPPWRSCAPTSAKATA